MQIFISYASEDRNLAEQIQLKLVSAGHQVFFDKTSLPTAQSYDLRIENAVKSADLFVFLISPDSVASGSYARTELKYAQQKWGNPEGRLVSVLARETAINAIPNYVKAVTWLETDGDKPAEVLAAVQSLGVEVPRISQVHEYSGTWSVRNSFSRWRGRVIKDPDKVYFVGKSMLIIPFQGDGGAGIQIGKLHVRVGDYRATYDIVNEVTRASVAKTGTLTMTVKVVRRQLIDVDPPPPSYPHVLDVYADLRRDLLTKGFKLVLSTVPDKINQLEGPHEHEEAADDFDQEAREKYVYEGLFIPPGISDL